MCYGHHYPLTENRANCAVCAGLQDAFHAYHNEFSRILREAKEAKVNFKTWEHPCGYETRSLKSVIVSHLKRAHGLNFEDGMLL